MLDLDQAARLIEMQPTCTGRGLVLDPLTSQLDSLVVSAPEAARSVLRKLTSKQRVRICGGVRPGSLDGPNAAAKTALRALACR
ncbi:hypothetical protein Raf01_71770 [Rugosimonospora africana]|uniref:Uncharacterized protein n=1 Tax=Rugosimonospora africana TaxID=556532 RepID=A0A8J3QX30_9ACTN|nr:hypothetical protein Raf01_71770 [Rugosimonospora africana]